MKIPVHIAIIADGNRRWAKERGLPTFEGHRRGAENVKLLSKRAKALGVKIITFWVFSTENWKRTVEETGYLMSLFDTFVDRERKEAIKEKNRIIHMGRKDRIPEGLRKRLSKLRRKQNILPTIILWSLWIMEGEMRSFVQLIKYQISKVKCQISKKVISINILTQRTYLNLSRI